MTKFENRLLAFGVITAGLLYFGDRAEIIEVRSSQESGELQFPIGQGDKTEEYFINRDQEKVKQDLGRVVTQDELSGFASEMRESNRVDCPVETGMAYLAIRGSEERVQICVDSEKVLFVPDPEYSRFGEDTKKLIVPLVPDPASTLFFDWVDSVATVSDDVCSSIEEALEDYMIVRLSRHLNAGEQINVDRLNIDVSFSPASCGLNNAQ